MLIPVYICSKYFVVAPSTMRPGRDYELEVMILDASGDVNIEATIQGMVYNRDSRTYELVLVDRRQATFSPGECFVSVK